MGSSPKSQVRTGLTAGGKWIRTLGPAFRYSSSRDRLVSVTRFPFAKTEITLSRTGDRGFESCSLQLRVSGELPKAAALRRSSGTNGQIALGGVLESDRTLMSMLVSVSGAGWPVHHAQHRWSAGLEEAPDEKPGENQKGQVQPAGIVGAEVSAKETFYPSLPTSNWKPRSWGPFRSSSPAAAGRPMSSCS